MGNLARAGESITAAGVIAALAYVTLAKIDADFAALVAIFIAAAVATALSLPKAPKTPQASGE
jgi:hypothetical protein